MHTRWADAPTLYLYKDAQGNLQLECIYYEHSEGDDSNVYRDKKSAACPYWILTGRGHIYRFSNIQDEDKGQEISLLEMYKRLDTGVRVDWATGTIIKGKDNCQNYDYIHDWHIYDAPVSPGALLQLHSDQNLMIFGPTIGIISPSINGEETRQITRLRRLNPDKNLEMIITMLGDSSIVKTGTIFETTTGTAYMYKIRQLQYRFGFMVDAQGVCRYRTDGYVYYDYTIGKLIYRNDWWEKWWKGQEKIDPAIVDFVHSNWGQFSDVPEPSFLYTLWFNQQYDLQQLRQNSKYKPSHLPVWFFGGASSPYTMPTITIR